MEFRLLASRLQDAIDKVHNFMEGSPGRSGDPTRPTKKISTGRYMSRYMLKLQTLKFLWWGKLETLSLTQPNRWKFSSEILNFDIRTSRERRIHH